MTRTLTYASLTLSFIMVLITPMKAVAEDEDAIKDVKDKTPVFIITTMEGEKFKVKGVRLYINEQTRTFYSDSFTVRKAEADITVKLHDLDGLINTWTLFEVTLFFPNKQVLTAKILDADRLNSITGKLLMADNELDFKMPVENMYSMFRVGFDPNEEALSAAGLEKEDLIPHKPKKRRVNYLRPQTDATSK